MPALFPEAQSRLCGARGSGWHRAVFTASGWEGSARRLTYLFIYSVLINKMVL